MPTRACEVLPIVKAVGNTTGTDCVQLTATATSCKGVWLYASTGTTAFYAVVSSSSTAPIHAVGITGRKVPAANVGGSIFVICDDVSKIWLAGTGTASIVAVPVR
jgi:hypothetical protein